MDLTPIDLQKFVDSFDDLWNPRILTQINDYDVRVAKIKGDFIWHVHENTDELFLILDGSVDMGIRAAADQDETVHLHKGAIFRVPTGITHKPTSSDGAVILLFEKTGTLNVGDVHDDLPGYISPTTGQPGPAQSPGR